MEENEKRWKEYVIKAPPLPYSCQVLFYKPDGKLNIGRPRKRWRDQII
jgi:hypothetical protein